MGVVFGVDTGARIRAGVATKVHVRAQVQVQVFMQMHVRVCVQTLVHVKVLVRQLEPTLKRMYKLRPIQSKPSHYDRKTPAPLELSCDLKRLIH